MHQNPDSNQTWKVLLLIYLNIQTHSSITTDFVSSFKISIEQIILVEAQSIKKSFNVFLGSKIWQSEDSKMSY